MRSLSEIICLPALIAFTSLFTGCASWRDTNPKIYDTRASGEQQLAESLRRAQTERKRVLLSLGANWCSDSQAMFRLFNTNAEIQHLISERYVFGMIDVNQRGLRARNAALLARLGIPVTTRIPVLLVLDEQGVLLNTDPGEHLADSDHAHPSVVLAYLRKWAEQP